MTGILSHTAETHLIEPGGLHELVRGQECEFVERLTPIVRRQSVTLDMSNVERIDASGIAALISLYGSAHSAGNDFNIVRANHHVAEILALVGLDRVLLGRDADPAPLCEQRLVRSAA